MFKEKTEVAYLPCDPRHNFHLECIKTWFANTLNCPVCKTNITLETAQTTRKYYELIDFIKQKDEEEYNVSRKTTLA